MQIKNLTPHSLTIYPLEGDTPLMTLPSEGTVRAQEDRYDGHYLRPDGLEVPTTYVTYGQPEGLPDPQDSVVLVVSTIAYEAARQSGRTLGDLYVPGAMVRGPDGRIVGCRGLAQPAGAPAATANAPQAVWAASHRRPGTLRSAWDRFAFSGGLTLVGAALVGGLTGTWQPAVVGMLALVGMVSAWIWGHVTGRAA